MGRTTAIRVVFAVLAIGFFAAPIAARILGVSAETFENRRLAQPPKLSQGWNAFQQTTRYINDHMPLRAQAVRANTRIWTDVFGTTPRYGQQTMLANDQALPFAGSINAPRDKPNGSGLQGATAAKTGRGGWSFIDIEFEYACDDSISNETVLDRWGKLVHVVREGGGKAMLFVVPEKASVYPEHLPEKYPFDHCALSAKEKLWRRLSKDGPALGIHELRSELLRLKADAGDRLYERKDFHWTTLGALVLVKASLDALGEGVRLDSNEIVARGVSRDGGTDAVARRSAAGKNLEYDIVRADGAPLVPGRTLLVCDSFAYRWMRLFKPYFENVRYISLYEDAHDIADAIRRSDRVIFEAEEVNLKADAVRDKDVMSTIRDLRAGKRSPRRSAVKAVPSP
jgi:hypothetical protein